MRLLRVPIHNHNPITLTCIACGKRVDQAHGDIYADLDGAFFRDYYCQACKDDIEREIDSRRASEDQEWFASQMVDQ